MDKKKPAKKNVNRKQTFILGEKKLTLEQVVQIACHPQRWNVVLAPAAARRMNKSYAFLCAETKKGKTIYGVNTGFGLFSNIKVSEAELEQLQVNLLRSHATGRGPCLSEPEVRAMLLLRASNLAIGHSGVRVAVVEQILNLLNIGIVPQVPEKGSVGASGDLAPLSHLALPLIGEGLVSFQGEVLPGAEALQRAGMTPLRLGPKEGLALINGTQFMTAVGILAWSEAKRLALLADTIGCMSLEAMCGTDAAFDPDIHRVRPHRGQMEVAARLKQLLKGSGILKHHKSCERVQDAYSLRCMPQVHGASWDTLRFIEETLSVEINSVTDNPLVFPQAGKVLSGGNFHGQYVSMALDFLAIAMAEYASISEQRIEKLMNTSLSGLPPFLTKNGGINSGFMIVQVAAASLVSENKTLCHPACVDTIPTSADKEDHVSMGAWAAIKGRAVVQNVRRVLAMELLCAAQGLDFLRPLKSSAAIEKMHRQVRSRVAFMEQDRWISPDLDQMEELLLSCIL